MYYTIYKITNLISGKQYIGKHRSQKKRDSYLGSSLYLRRDIQRLGKENFKYEVLEYLPDQCSMDLREQELITPEIRESKDWYNINPGPGNM